jgi:hypothetical protein
MNVLIWGVVLGVLASIIIGIGEYGLGLGLLGLKDEKYRLTSLLVITPIAILCCLTVVYIGLSLPIWMSLLLSPLILVGGIAVALLLVNRALPRKIRERW